MDGWPAGGKRTESCNISPSLVEFYHVTRFVPPHCIDLTFRTRSRRQSWCCMGCSDLTVSRYSEEDAWLVGVGKRAPHGFRCLYNFSVGSIARRKAYTLLL